MAKAVSHATASKGAVWLLSVDLGARHTMSEYYKAASPGHCHIISNAWTLRGSHSAETAIGNGGRSMMPVNRGWAVISPHALSTLSFQAAVAAAAAIMAEQGNGLVCCCTARNRKRSQGPADGAGTGGGIGDGTTIGIRIRIRGSTGHHPSQNPDHGAAAADDGRSRRPNRIWNRNQNGQRHKSIRRGAMSHKESAQCPWGI